MPLRPEAPPQPEAQARILHADSRSLAELPDRSVSLVVTSPPYWQIKDYGVEGQVGFGQSLHHYLLDLARVWGECARVLQDGRRLCINIGDQFARATVYGRYKVIPLHAEIIAQCESCGLDYLGAIIWQKRTTLRPSGGAVIMGSFPFPPNGIVELDYEYILLFKKPGKPPKLPPAVRAAARLTKDEWKEYFAGHWTFPAARQEQHEAMFPLELPRRLIRMFSFPGETVLDPFLGSGTTAVAAITLDRSAIGVELQPTFVEQAVRRLQWETGLIVMPERRSAPTTPAPPPATYQPRVQDAQRTAEDDRVPEQALRRVTEILDAHALRLDDGQVIRLLGITVPPDQEAAAVAYLQSRIRGKRVLLQALSHSAEEAPPSREPGLAPEVPRAPADEVSPSGDEGSPPQTPVENGQAVYLRLSNRLFINRVMIEMGLATPTPIDHPHRRRFEAAARRPYEAPDSTAYALPKLLPVAASARSTGDSA